MPGSTPSRCWLGILDGMEDRIREIPGTSIMGSSRESYLLADSYPACT